MRVNGDVFGVEHHIAYHGAIAPTCAVVQADKDSRSGLKIVRGNVGGIGGDKGAIVEDEDVVRVALGAGWVGEFSPRRGGAGAEVHGAIDAAGGAVHH
jgi:hypothetical protein